MRGRFVVVCVISALGACDSPSGTFINVKPPPGTARVELLVAPVLCDPSGPAPCASAIAWDDKTLTVQPVGDMFSLSSDLRDFIDVAGGRGSVTLRLDGLTDQDRHPARLAVVAFDAHDQALAFGIVRDLDISADDGERLTVPLTALADHDIAANADPDAPPASPDVAIEGHVWRPPLGGQEQEDASYASCVATQTWNGQSWDREFYVPGDADCDNVTTMECDSFWYAHSSTSQFSCVTPRSRFCVVGGSSCTDGSPSSPCTSPSGPPFICVPDAVCHCSDPNNALMCVKDTVLTNFASPTPTMTYLDCTFTSSSMSTLCRTPFEANIYLAVDCSSVLLYKLGNLAFPISSNLLGTLTTTGQTTMPLTFAGNTQTELTVALLNQTSACQLNFTWAGGVGVIDAPVPTPPPILIDVVRASGDHVIVPLHFSFPLDNTSACGPNSVATCGLTGAGSGDGEFACGG